MSLPNFTAEASIGSHESYTHAKGKYQNYDSSLIIEPARALCDCDGCVEHCIADGCISTSGGRICRGWSCAGCGYGGSVLYQYYQYGWHFLEDTRNPPVEP
jgi:hypothetical protein